MDSTIVQKFIEMAKKMGASPETISAIEKDISKPTTVVVAKVTKVWAKPEDQIKAVSDCCDYSDEEIDKMDEKWAKDALKKCRDACKQEDQAEWWDMPQEWLQNTGMKMQDVFNRIG